MGTGPGFGGAFVIVQDRVLLLLWVLGWGWAWIGTKQTLTGSWVRHGRLSDVDVAALMTATAMLAFSFAPSYTFVDHHLQTPGQACGDLTGADRARCVLETLRVWRDSKTGYNAWHQTSTALPVVMVLAVGALVVLRAAIPLLLPAVLVRIVTRVMLLLAILVFGWAIFSPSLEIFQQMHYGWGLWACLGCLVLMTFMAMATPPRYVQWLIA